MAEKHGGSRPEAGRPKKDRTPAEGEVFKTAQDYLEAVVCGTVAPDALRISAAKCLISYQARKQRVPKPAPAPAALARSEARQAETEAAKAFEVVAAGIRKKHGRA